MRAFVGKILFCALSVAGSLFVTVAFGRESLKFEGTVHDFGQILISDGAVSCKFKATNISKEDVVIQSVATSCGCTSVKWDHNPIAPGKTTEISATYTNDEGPYSFDKTLTVKILGEDKPVLLHLRGLSQNVIKSDAEIYTYLYNGVFGLADDSFKCPNLEQGGSRGDQTMVANLSAKAVKVSFMNVSDGLSLDVQPNPIPAKGHATLFYTVSSRPDKWGRNLYSAQPVTDGKASEKKITIEAFTTENFSGLTAAQKKQGSRPVFAQSTYSFGHKKQGAKLTATFVCENKGASPLVIYKIDSDYSDAVPGSVKSPVAPGSSCTLTVPLDTSSLPKGETLVIVTLTTNSPTRPIVNLFLAGIID